MWGGSEINVTTCYSYHGNDRKLSTLKLEIMGTDNNQTNLSKHGSDL
jgi:hypothetical protein